MLSESARAAGYRLIVRDAVGSTMEEARRALHDGDPGKLWIVAREQTAGRGRHGRVWGSPPGNLYASLLLTNPCEPALAPQLGFVAGLALHDAASQLVGAAAAADLMLKWPNDLLIARAKTAGLLLEGESRAGRLDLIIGFGVNIASCPQDTPYPAIALAASGPGVTVQALLAALSEAWIGRFETWSRPGGFGPTRTAWLERAAFLGETITIRLGEGPLSGVFAGLDASGRLELDIADGRRIIDAGDLYFAAPA